MLPRLTKQEVIKQDTKSGASNVDEENSKKEIKISVSGHESRPDCNKFDIANYKNVKETDKYTFISNIWKPDDSFVFPRSQHKGQNFSCKHGWLQQYEWLEYSLKADKVFCRYCVFYPNGQRGDLAIKGLNFWKSATSKFSVHNESKSHLNAKKDFAKFLKTTKYPEERIDNQVRKSERTKIEKNRAKLIPIIKCVLFLAKQGLAFRGHRDDLQHIQKGDKNPGNFQALLKLCSDIGSDSNLAKHLENAPKNATYRSKTIQNQIINVVGDKITDEIVKGVKESKFFSVLADEATDVSNKEQMSLVLRYVDENLKVKEDFVKFIHCDTGFSGEQLAMKILEEIEKLGLSMDNCRGQGYDGAGAMAGKDRGVANRIVELFAKAIYMHCFSHILNLAVMKCVKIEMIKSMFEYCRVISDFFNNSPKRSQFFAHVMKEEYRDMPGEKQKKLLKKCQTRWVERINALAVFLKCYTVTYNTLKRISNNEIFNGSEWRPDSRLNASGLYHHMEKFQFIVCLVMCKHILAYTKALTVSLQGK